MASPGSDFAEMQGFPDDRHVAKRDAGEIERTHTVSQPLRTARLRTGRG